MLGPGPTLGGEGLASGSGEREGLAGWGPRDGPGDGETREEGGVAGDGEAEGEGEGLGDGAGDGEGLAAGGRQRSAAPGVAAAQAKPAEQQAPGRGASSQFCGGIVCGRV